MPGAASSRRSVGNPVPKDTISPREIVLACSIVTRCGEYLDSCAVRRHESSNGMPMFCDALDLLYQHFSGQNPMVFEALRSATLNLVRGVRIIIEQEVFPHLTDLGRGSEICRLLTNVDKTFPWLLTGLPTPGQLAVQGILRLRPARTTDMANNVVRCDGITRVRRRKKTGKFYWREPLQESYRIKL
jgi:hypothetical protein